MGAILGTRKMGNKNRNREERIDGAEFIAAAEEGHINVVLKALEKDSSLLLLRDVAGDSVLHLAAKVGNCDAISKLLRFAEEQGQMLKVMLGANADGDTALHLAYRNGHRQAAEKLVDVQMWEDEDKYAAVFAVNKDGVSPWDLAQQAGDEAMLRLMSIETTQPCATVDMEMELALSALQDFTEDEQCNPKCDWNTLSNAARKGLHEMVRKIVEEDPKLVLHVDQNVGTVLHVAASANQLGTLAYLTQFIKTRSKLRDAICKRDYFGNVPLHVAMNIELKTVAYEMIELAPRTVYLGNSKGDSPLYLAVKMGLEDFVCFMIRRTLADQARGEEMLSHAVNVCLAHVAIKFNNLGTLQVLLEQLPCLISSTDTKGWKPLTYAINKGHLNHVSYILKNFPDSAELSDRDGSFPIHKAVAAGKINVVETFQAFCPQTLGTIDKKGRNSLHIAASYAKGDMLAYLVQQEGIEEIFNLNNDQVKYFRDLAKELKSKSVSKNV